MVTDENREISVWLLGNTGLRNPQRLAEGFKVFAASPFVGNLYGKENEINFMHYLHDNGIIKNEPGKDESASHARKWRLIFEKTGLIYRKLEKSVGNQEDYGPISFITPFGYSFIRANTYPAQQECFLRSYSVEQIKTTDGTALFSPLRWILAVMLELERRTGSTEISRTEFALWGHTTDPTYDLDYVVDNILDLRQRRQQAPSKRVFDRNETEIRGELYKKKSKNFFDYCDMNMRYLRITGVMQRKGRGLIIDPTKRAIAADLAKTTVSDKSLFEAYRILANGAPLPSDNLDIARELLSDVEAIAKERHVFYDISNMPLNTPAEVNLARLHVEYELQRVNEILYAEQQRKEWVEIVNYMRLIEKGGGTSRSEDADTSIEVPRDETPAYLEWILWRALLAIDHLANQPYEVRGFRIDSDFLPVNTAGGGRGDLYCEFSDFLLVVEVSMSTSSRQEAMEGEPVRRHVSDAIDDSDKPVYGLFIAVKVDTNTAETFRHGVWYDRDDNKRRLDILPLTLEQFREFFTAMFMYKNTSPELLKDLIVNCGIRRDILNGPTWKEYIRTAVAKIIDDFEYGVVEVDNKAEDLIIPPGAIIEHPEFGIGQVIVALVNFECDEESEYNLPFISSIPDTVKLSPNGYNLEHEIHGKGVIYGYKVAFGDRILIISRERMHSEAIIFRY